MFPVHGSNPQRVKAGRRDIGRKREKDKIHILIRSGSPEPLL
jgi:hypothetical protein